MKRNLKWYDPFWRHAHLLAYGEKNRKETWLDFVNRLGIKLPKDIDKDKLKV